MRLPWDSIQSNAVAFSKRWKDAKNEEAQAQAFLIDFLRVFGINDPESIGNFEYKVPLKSGRTGYIDYVWKSKIAIEMKSRGKNLDEAYHQLQTYMQSLNPDEMPDLWLVSDFENMRLYRRSANQIFNFKTKDLRKNIRLFADIAGYEAERIIENQIQVNVKAAEKMAKLHSGLFSFGYEGHNLEVYLVRLLFCMFADDTGIFTKDSFYHYIEQSKEDGSDLSFRIFNLFGMLNTPEDVRAKRANLAELYNQFKYINGALFESPLPPANFNEKMRGILLDCINFDWAEISPAIFGAMFQGVMDEKQRREMGAHYTSEENILKLINPLFMDDLWAEFHRVKTNEKALDAFHSKIAKLKFLDPACGCGNFLIITYRELRALELEILRMKHSSHQLILDISSLLKVTVEQFYGIEYENFPCQIAQVGMWLIDHQMNLRVGEFGIYHERLPLTQSATIVHGNALQLDWNDIVPKYELSYILGNPPFLGKKEQSKEQKADLIDVFGSQKGIGNLDYVPAWYKKAAMYAVNTSIKTAFVSTNSIAQGEQPAVLWKSIIDSMKIDFAYRTFKWTNEAKGKAAVHCVIIGFSPKNIASKRYIFDGEEKAVAANINPYLVDATDVLIESRTKMLCKAPRMVYGSMPIDNGALILSHNEYEKLQEAEPGIDKFVRRYMGGDELLNDTKRYCLWLKDIAPKEIVKSKFIAERVRQCREFRESSNRPQTKVLADTPHLFGEIRQPEGTMLVIPKVSSENRRYLPIGFLTPDIIVNGSALIIPTATLYHFGVLSSNVHNAWMRAVCGRLEMRYQYSANIVYNNFPWVTATNAQIAEIEKLSQAILEERAKHGDSTLAELYNPDFMGITGLLKAHRNLDTAIMNLYDFPVKKEFTEAHCVAALMEMYQKLTEG